MRHPIFSGLGFRLLIIVLTAALPILGLILYIDYDQRLKATENAEENLNRYTALISSDIGQVVAGADQFLVALAQLDEVRQMNSAGCSAVFTRLRIENPVYINITASDSNGNVFCSGQPLSGPINLSDRTHFQDAVKYKRFIIGSFITSRSTGDPTLPFAYPVLDQAGDPQSVISVLLDLTRLNRYGITLNLPADSVFVVTDRSGAILARYPDPGNFIGKTVQDSALVQSIHDGGKGILNVTGSDGIKRLYSYSPVSNSGQSLYVAVGIPSATVYADVERTTNRNLIVLAITGLLAFAAAALFSRFSLLKPIQGLVDTTRRLEQGDLSARASVAAEGELAWLANSFNGMAASLEEKNTKLSQAEYRYRTLVEQIPAITYRGEFGGSDMNLYISPQVETLLGYSPQEIIDNPRLWFEAIHPDDRDRVMKTFADPQPGIPWKNEFRMLTKQGATLWFRDEGVANADNGNETAMLHGVMFNITERQQILETLRQERDLIERVMETSPAGILVMNRQGNILYLNHQAEQTLGYSQQEIFNQNFNWPGWDVRDDSGNPLTTGDLPFEEVLDRKHRITDYQMNFHNPRKGRVFLSVNAAPFVDGAGEVTGVIATLEDVTELRKQRHEMEALVSFTAALRNATNRNEMYSIVLSQIVDLLSVDGAALVTVTQPSSDMTFQLGLGAWSSLTGTRIPAGTGITARVVSSGQPYLNNEMQTAPDLYNIDGFFTEKITSGACVPLQTRGLTVGAVWIGKGSPLNDHDLNLVSTIADIAANAIHRAALFEQTQARLKRLSALHAVDMAITSSLDLRVTLSILLDQVISQMGVDASSILLLNPETQTLEYAAGRGFSSGKIQQTRLHLGELYAGQVALTRRPVMMPDVTKATGERFPIETENFMAYFAEPLVAKGQVKGVLQLFHRAPFFPDQEWIDFLHALATQAAIAIDNTELFNTLQRTNDELTLAYDATIEGWSRALELRDRESQGHSERVTDLTLRIARKMGVKDYELSHYRRGVLLHDIGKMAIPEEILMKPGPLTPDEWEIMKLHPRYAYELLYPVPYLRRAVDIPYCHHEHWDGSGYPRGLKAEAIPLSARIFTVVDVWDALRSIRPYREAWPETQAETFIRTKAGVQFDPKVVETFFDIIKNRHN